MWNTPSFILLQRISTTRVDNQYWDVNLEKTNLAHISYRLPHVTITPLHISASSVTDTHRLLQVGDEDTDDQRVYVNVVHAVQWWLGGGPYGLVDGLFAGAVGGTVVRVVGKALGHLILTGGGAPGHSQQARRIQLEQMWRGKNCSLEKVGIKI